MVPPEDSPNTVDRSDATRAHREIWRLAAPMILANMSPPLIGFVDTAVVGHLGAAYYIGAVAVGAIMFSFAYTALNFLRMTTTGLAAQAAGAADGTHLRTVLAQAVGSAVYLAVLLLIVHRPLGRLALDLIGPSDLVRDAAWSYFVIRIWSAPATLATMALIGWFVGLGNGRAALAMVLVTNIVNLALDLWFVPVLGLGVPGVAWAAVIAESVGALTGLAISRRALRAHPGAWDRAAITSPHGLRKLFAGNANLFLRTLALMFTFAFVTTMGARQGDAVLAANAILINLQYFMAYVLDGLANAAESLTGRAIGARDRAALAAKVRLGLAWIMVTAVGISFLYAVAGRWIVGIATSVPGVLEETARYLPWVIALPLVCAPAFLYDGVFVGALRSREMRDVMLLALVLFLPAWYLARPFGNHGLWLAFLLFNGARGAAQHLLYRRWMRTGELIPATKDSNR